MPEPLRVVVIEDDAVQRQALKDVLMMEGLHCEAFASPEQALSNPALMQSDLLITDLNLPGMNGLELIQQVRQTAPEMSAILMTGHATLQTAIDAVRVGAVDYLLKPFRLSTMLSTVSRALEQQRLRREVLQLQQDLKARYEEVLLINKELDAFAARISHDLRGPITNMKMVLNTLRTEASQALDDDLLSLVDAGVRAGEKATRMVHDLLALSRLGASDMQLEPVDLDALMPLVLAELQGSHPPQGCAIQTGALGVVLGHEGLLHQAFVNLIGNAIKYSSPRQNPVVRIEARAADQPGFAHISVSDNGVGFPPGHEHELFKPFRRLHHANQFPGEGMGLANVKRIVDRHGGFVQASLVPQGGACFTLTLMTARP